MKNMKLIVLIEVAIMAALAVVVDLIPSIKLTPSISFNVAMGLQGGHAGRFHLGIVTGRPRGSLGRSSGTGLP